AHADAVSLGRWRADRPCAASLAEIPVVGRDPLRPASALEPRRDAGMYRLGALRRASNVHCGRRRILSMNQIVILMYHIVAQPASTQEARYCCTPQRFEAQMRHLGKAGLPLLA